MANHAVFGVMRDEATMQWMLTVLGRAGFSSTDISVLMPTQPAGSVLEPPGARRQLATRRADATFGGTLGLLGTLGARGRLGALAIPGFGPLIAAGPILAALGGAAVGAAMGSVAGGLIGLGIPEALARRYERKLRGGSLLVAVHTNGVPHIAAATTVLETHGADDLVIATQLAGFAKSSPSRAAVC